ncbi:hypothetical protein FOL47_008385 [Perkinsus chesapeaki]|uniref:Uncharacterized protein n=1 Tax=Perkinsus chesapeaki TaxID=330153 RepID=A0A7J6LEA5_PERCH|nr:hypothetical protein FOL47_008385 [Perkinsus chesapeaki]
MFHSTSEVSLPGGGSSIFDITTTRVAVIDELIEDAKRIVWSYLPTLVPNTMEYEEELNLPTRKKYVESDTYESLYGLLANGTKKIVCAVREVPGRRKLETEGLFKLEREVVLCFVYRNHLYFTARKGSVRVWKVSLDKGDGRLTSIVCLPETIRQIKLACGCLFLLGVKSNNLYMIDSVSDEPKKVGELPADGPYRSKLVFQGAVVH